MDEEIFEAFLDGNFERVKELIKNGVDINIIQNNNGWNLLHFSYNNNNLNIINFLINNGININLKDKNNSTPLHIVCYYNSENLDIIKILIKNGADINTRDILGETPLHDACIQGCIEIVDELVNGGGDLYYIKNDNEETPLDVARNCGHLHIIEKYENKSMIKAAKK